MLATEAGKVAYAHWKAERPVRAVAMFRAGTDTLKIAHSLAVRETTILRWVTEERCRRRGLPSPYQSKVA